MIKILQLSILYATFNVLGAAIIKNKLLANKIVGLQDFMVFLIDSRIVLAIFFIFISMYFSIKALSIGYFSSVIPLMTAVNFIVTVSVGLLYFKEQLAITGYIGILLILAGVLLLGKGYSG